MISGFLMEVTGYYKIGLEASLKKLKFSKTMLRWLFKGLSIDGDSSFIVVAIF